MRKVVSRRTALGAPAAMLLASSACAQEKPAAGGSRTLVVYFTRSGNTRVIAGLLQRDLGAALFEIEAAEPYPADYEATVAQASRERAAQFEPPLKAKVRDIDAFDTVYLGFPVWGETAPPIIRSFLSAHDLTGKTVRPFITHGGFGQGSCLEVLKSGAPRALFREALVLEADQERRTIGQVRTWLAGRNS